MTIFYDFEYEGQLQEFDCESKKALEKRVDDWWADKSYEDAEGNLAAGEQVKDFGYILTFGYDTDANPIELSREVYHLVYEHQDSDYDQHAYHGI